MTLIRQLLELRKTGWRLQVRRILFFVVSGSLFTGATAAVIRSVSAGAAICAVLLLLLPLTVRIRFRVRGAFIEDARRDATAKMRFASLILREFVQKQPVAPRRKPLLFPASGKLYRRRSQENVMAEAGLKSFFRNRSRIKMYLQIVFVFLIGVVITANLLANLIIWLVCGFILLHFCRIYWLEFAKHPFLSLFAKDEDQQFQAKGKYMQIVILPGYLAVGALALVVTLPWLSALPLWIGGTLVILVVSRFY
jgi:hypothetical protein